MSATLQRSRPASEPLKSAPAPAPQTPAAAPEPAASTSWASDRLALAVWLTGALLMAALLLKDLLFAVVSR
jgi:hypothetical protein